MSGPSLGSSGQRNYTIEDYVGSLYNAILGDTTDTTSLNEPFSAFNEVNEYMEVAETTVSVTTQSPNIDWGDTVTSYGKWGEFEWA